MATKPFFVDAVFTIKRQKFYMVNHPYLGPTYYYDKNLDSQVDWKHVSKVLYRRYTRWFQKHHVFEHIERVNLISESE